MLKKTIIGFCVISTVSNLVYSNATKLALKFADKTEKPEISAIARLVLIMNATTKYAALDAFEAKMTDTDIEAAQAAARIARFGK